MDVFVARQPISSIRQAKSFLGYKDFKLFVTLIATSGLTEDKPAELIRLSIIQGHFLEKVGEETGKNGGELFLLGLFSLIDAILDKHIEEILQNCRFPLIFIKHLVAGKGRFFPLYDLWKAMKAATGLPSDSPEKKCHWQTQNLSNCIWNRLNEPNPSQYFITDRISPKPLIF